MQKEYNYANGIKIRVEPYDMCKGAVKIYIDTGSVSFNVYNLPSEYTETKSFTEYRNISEKYYGIPMLYESCIKLGKWFYMYKYAGNDKVSTYFANGDIVHEEFAYTLVIDMKIIVDKLIEVGYIKVEDVKLMTKIEMLKLLDEGKALASEIAKERWIRIKKYAEIHTEIKNIWDILDITDSGVCALCEKYKCYECPIPKIDKKCIDNCSTYDRTQRTTTNEDFLIAVDNMITVLNKAIEIEKNKEEIIKHTFGSLTVILNKKSDEEVYVTFEGLKGEDELSEEYVKGYPSIVKYNGDAYKIRNSDGLYISSTGLLHDYSYSMFNDAKKSIETANKIVSIVSECVDRLHEINHTKVETKMENIFNGMDKYVDKIIYDFNGCIVTIKKVPCDKYSIDINPGPFDFINDSDNEDTHRKYSNACKYRLENGISSFKAQWWIGECEDNWIGDGEHFSNGNTFTAEYINIILKNIKSGVDYFTSIKKEVTILTPEEMYRLLDKGEMLPSEICKLKYTKIRDYVVENRIEKWDQLPETGAGSTCALCRKYTCIGCPLKLIGDGCGTYSNYTKLSHSRDTTHNELLGLIDNMIASLDKAIIYEREHKNHSVYHAGKMKITVTPDACDKVKVVIEGMKCYVDLPTDYECRSSTRAYTFKDNTFVIEVDDEWFIKPSEGASVSGYICTKEKAMKIVEALQRCSKVLHDINE